VVFQADKDLIRAHLNKYTRKAFQMLPEQEKPRILDIGCGSGVPTMELARLSNGEIIGIDINQSPLDILAEKIEKAGLGDRVKTVKGSMFELGFPDNHFDIIWAEGSISVIGFKRGLEEWKRLLKPKGFLVIHDEIGQIEEKSKQLSACGYGLLGSFVLSEDTWWNEYYILLEKRIQSIRTKHADNPKASAVLDAEQREIEMFKQNPGRYRSVFFIMKKR